MFHQLGLAAAAALSALAAHSQPVAAPAATPAFRSALDGYQPFTDEKLVPWREANDNVGRIGGWRAYAREAQGQPSGLQATPASPAPAPSGAQPASPAPANPHSGHGKQ